MPTHVINQETEDVQLPIFQRKVILTDAQIKALPTTPFEILPTPGEGKMIKYVSGMMVLDTVAGAYTNVGATTASGYYLTYEGGADASNYNMLSIFYQAGQLRFVPNISTPFNKNPDGNLLDTFTLVSNVVNKNLTLSVYNDDGADNDAGDFTGGHADNTLEVTVFYSIVNL